MIQASRVWELGRGDAYGDANDARAKRSAAGIVESGTRFGKLEKDARRVRRRDGGPLRPDRKVLLGLLILVLAALGFVVAAAVLSSNNPVRSTVPAPEEKTPDLSVITCLGHIEPEDGLIQIAARSISGQPAIVGRLLVKEGDRVASGQLIAVLDSRDQLEAEWLRAEAEVKVARNRLNQVKAGAKQADIAAQQAEIASIESELLNARTELGRNETLHKRNVVSTSVLDSSRLLAETKTSMLKEAREKLAAMSEVRPVDVALAAAEVDSAVADANRARAEFNLALIRSPFNGRVVKIHAWPGEEVDPDGIMDLAKTDRMYVIAEVIESDVPRLRIGQSANITGSALPRGMHGTVSEIGLKIAKSQILNIDPALYSDSRVVDVKILLNDSRSVEGLIHAQVNVAIAIK